MNDVDAVRILRLERLESRSLLAGGVFDFTVFHGNFKAERPSPINQPAIVQDNPARPQVVAQDTTRTRAEPAQNASVSSASVTIESAALQASPPNSLSPSALPQAELRQPNAIDAAVVALANENSSVVDSESTIELLTDEVSSMRSEETLPVVETESLTARQVNAFGLSLSDRSSTLGDDYIELTPLDPFESVTEESNPWQLESRIIPLIKQAHERPMVEQPLGERAELINQWMQDGLGELIALEQVILPANKFPLEATLGSANLQSTVALHRSLNLVAGSLSPALSGQVLDEIMASFERMTDSKVQPVIEPSPFRIPTVVYPNAAVVATTIGIAIAARRKRKHPQTNLQFSGGQ